MASHWFRFLYGMLLKFICHSISSNHYMNYKLPAIPNWFLCIIDQFHFFYPKSWKLSWRKNRSPTAMKNFCINGCSPKWVGRLWSFSSEFCWWTILHFPCSIKEIRNCHIPLKTTKINSTIWRRWRNEPNNGRNSCKVQAGCRPIRKLLFMRIESHLQFQKQSGWLF